MAKILNVVVNPDPILRKKSSKVQFSAVNSKEMLKLLDDMTLTMKEKDGIGLAAPQIGKNLRIIVVNTKDGSICMLNPIIVKKSLLKENGEEGCLSLPGIFCTVKRHKKVECSYLDKSGQKQQIKASGLLARVLQHEIDHLDGILFIDKKVK